MEYENLEELLETGKLSGCVLKGNAQTGQLGLVSTTDLEPNEVVAVDCGILWSESLHDEFIAKKDKDPLLGLATDFIPAQVLKDLACELEWEEYIDACGGEADGFVLDSSEFGNETRHIDDPGWLCMSTGNMLGSDVPKPNLEARVVLDLKRKLLSVAYETTCKVAAGKELTMDWGCWPAICDYMLPGQAQISHLLSKRERALKQIARRRLVDLSSLSIGKVDHLIYFNAKKGAFDVLQEREEDIEDIINYRAGREKLGKEFVLLQKIIDSEKVRYSAQQEAWCRESGFDIEVYGAIFACPSTNMMDLSGRNRDRLKKCECESTFGDSKEMLYKNTREGVEVVEIIDPKNPANLFALPGQNAMGVKACKAYQKGDLVLSYGGIIKQLDESSIFDSSYIFDAFLPEEIHEGPLLIIDGAKSVGGMINDPWTPSGFPKRTANLDGRGVWDDQTRTPQIVFFAIKPIKKGEELVYNYGIEYWKVMWVNLILDHAKFATETALRCQAIRDAIAKDRHMTKEEVIKEEEELLTSTFI